MSNTTLHKIQTRFRIGRISENMRSDYVSVGLSGGRIPDRADIWSRRPRSRSPRYIFRTAHPRPETRQRRLRFGTDLVLHRSGARYGRTPHRRQACRAHGVETKPHMSNTTLHKIQTRFRIGRISENMRSDYVSVGLSGGRIPDRADIWSRRPRSRSPRYIFRTAHPRPETRQRRLRNRPSLWNRPCSTSLRRSIWSDSTSSTSMPSARSRDQTTYVEHDPAQNTDKIPHRTHLGKHAERLRFRRSVRREDS